MDTKKCNCSFCHFKSVVFNNLEDIEIDIVCQSKREDQYKKGDLIISEGKLIDEFLYLKSGLVKLYKQGEDGKDQIINIAKPFDFVSLLSVFSDTHYNFSISAIEDSTVCVMDLESIRELIKKNGLFGLRIMERMSQNSDKIIKTSIALSSKNLRGRIAYILLYFADEIYLSNEFELPISRKEIAQLISMTTENVIRILSEFRKDEVIMINGKTIIIKNRTLLERISQSG